MHWLATCNALKMRKWPVYARLPHGRTNRICSGFQTAALLQAFLLNVGHCKIEICKRLPVLAVKLHLRAHLNTALRKLPIGGEHNQNSGKFYPASLPALTMVPAVCFSDVTLAKVCLLTQIWGWLQPTCGGKIDLYLLKT